MTPVNTILVATSGGHLAQLFDLAGRIEPDCGRRLWVTFADEQARTLLAGEQISLIPFIAERDVAGVTHGAWHAYRILRAQRPARVVSTGSAIALSFLPVAAILGIEAHYIESAARVGTPSLTGQVLSRLPGIRLYRQYPHVARRRWHFGGSVLDGFRVVDIGARPVTRMVVTLGMTYGFKRLVERLAALIPKDVEVLWQTGHTDTEGLGIKAHNFVPASVLREAMAAADVVVAHAGCGSALTALKAGKCPVLVPRDPRCGEVVDVHQIELAEWLSSQKLAIGRTPEVLSFKDFEWAASRAVVRQLPLPDFNLNARLCQPEIPS